MTLNSTSDKHSCSKIHNYFNSLLQQNESWQIETVNVLRFLGTISDSSVCCWINVLPYRQTLISVQPLMLRLLPASLVFFWVTDSGWKRQSQNHTCSSSKLWSSPFFFRLSLIPTVVKLDDQNTNVSAGVWCSCVVWCVRTDSGKFLRVLIIWHKVAF